MMLLSPLASVDAWRLESNGPAPIVRSGSADGSLPLPADQPGGAVAPGAGAPGRLQGGAEPGGGNEEDGRLSRRLVGATTELLNRMLEEARRQLRFHVHEATGRIWVQVINPETQEVVKEIPPEKYLDMVARIWQLVGLLVDERA
ncbi:MAG: flagellar protein FlaG [Limnochordaceae bacterium]|nr:flagellar protein FlaG [Limnochordaceae bacterium]